ncbi:MULTISPECIES: hypothetical protein [unclassified Campylobacter]|uniref:hypothetical protein n=1 Tax=unclassified Campylobacter TaxID=2593542 RepID=UPI003D32DD32
MIISIDKYIFQVTNNIHGLTKVLNVNLEKTQTITKPVYTHMGGYEENISFEAKILLDNMNDFIGFENLIKQAKPLKISAFDLCVYNDIFITNLSQSVDNFVKTNLNGVWYYTKTLHINGIIING